MRNRIYSCFLLVLFFFISGCAHVISDDLRAKANLSASAAEVFQNPDAYKGKTVIWGGEIIQVLSQKDKTTLIEVLQWPLGWRGEPKRSVSFQGRFLVLVKGSLDPVLDYREGEKITVAGEILGEIRGDKIASLTETTYRYPLLLGNQVHLWEGYYYPYSSPQYQKDPWFYDPSERPPRF